jgi:hypothetical protein
MIKQETSRITEQTQQAEMKWNRMTVNGVMFVVAE